MTTDRSAWLNGGESRCVTVPFPLAGAPWRLVLLGAPGVGKGTQAELLCKRLGACHLSTGDIFRSASCRPEVDLSPALRTAFERMRGGALVADETVLALVGEREGCLGCRGGFVLDGFPRTVAQAGGLADLLLKEHVGLTAVLNYDLPVAKIIKRLSARRVCPDCKAVYNLIDRPPKSPGVCDRCGSGLIEREDDRPEAIGIRMAAYRRSIAPLIDFYRESRLLITVSAEGTAEQVYERTRLLLIGRLPAGREIPAGPIPQHDPEAASRAAAARKSAKAPRKAFDFLDGLGGPPPGKS